VISRRGVSPSRVFVHIADPTSWIPVDHEVDRHARDRVSTIYLPGMFLTACRARSLAQLSETSLSLCVRACVRAETIVPMLQPSIYRHFSLEPRRCLALSYPRVGLELYHSSNTGLPHVQTCTHRDNYAMTFAFKISSVDGAIEDYTISPSSISRVACDAIYAAAAHPCRPRHSHYHARADLSLSLSLLVRAWSWSCVPRSRSSPITK
jgi:hypothetical protein